MGAMKEHPRNNVISLRLTDEEIEYWSEQQKQTSKSLSVVIREALQRAMVPGDYYKEPQHN